MLKSLLSARSEQCLARESQDQPDPDSAPVTADVKKIVKESIGNKMFEIDSYCRWQFYSPAPTAQSPS